MRAEILENLNRTKQASRSLIHVEDIQITSILESLAELTVKETEFILRENQKDLQRMDPNDPKYDRLLLNEQRLNTIAGDLRKVASLPTPLGEVLEEKNLDNGLNLSKVRVPLGVVAVVYESRPNVTFDVVALCLKSGNASVLKGSRDAKDSNLAIISLINRVLETHCVDRNIVYLAPSEREALPVILSADQLIDIVIPRGSQGLINYVRQHAKVPVIETGAGICHIYFDRSAQLQEAKPIIINAKTRRVSVCNALDCLLMHRHRLEDLAAVVDDLSAHSVEIYADEAAYQSLHGRYPDGLLKKASEEDFGKEWLSCKLSIKVVDDMETALNHIARYSSKHSEAIVAQDQQVIDHFLKSVDAAVVYANASTAFTDGAEFGMGAEIGISTQKLHARGPMALPELTSYKWIVKGDGQTRV